MSDFLQGLGTVLSIFGALGEGQQQKDEADLQAGLEESRAIAEATRTADLEAQRRRVGRKLAGKQKAQFAHAGLRQEGTPLLVMQQTLIDTEADVSRIKATGEFKSFAYRTQAKRFRDVGKAREQRGFGRAGTSLITAIGDFIT